LSETNCPRIEENNQDIKGYKHKGIKIIAKIELNPCLTNGLHATLKGSVLDGTGIVRNNFEKSENNGKDNQEKGKKDCNDDK
jgi:hypothetical protein